MSSERFNPKPLRRSNNCSVVAYASKLYHSLQMTISFRCLITDFLFLRTLT